MVVLGAMVTGTPVIGGNQSGTIPFRLDQRKSGMLCDINSPEDIAKCVLKLLKNADLSEQSKVKHSLSRTMRRAPV